MRPDHFLLTTILASLSALAATPAYALPIWPNNCRASWLCEVYYEEVLGRKLPAPERRSKGERAMLRTFHCRGSNGGSFVERTTNPSLAPVWTFHGPAGVDWECREAR